MKTFAETTIGFVQRRQSRRGFMAMCGRAVAVLGFAMLGETMRPRKAYAACCPGPDCNSTWTWPCPAPGGAAHCPSGCSESGPPARCCDVSGLWDLCYQCNCQGFYCTCEYPTTDRC